MNLWCLFSPKHHSKKKKNVCVGAVDGGRLPGISGPSEKRIQIHEHLQDPNCGGLNTNSHQTENEQGLLIFRKS